MGMEWANRVVDQELHQRPCRHALAPVLPSDPIADLSFTGLVPAHDITGHPSVEEDRLHGDGLVAKDLGPVRHEPFLVSGGEGGHAVCFRVALVFEEDPQVAVDTVPQSHVTCGGVWDRDGRSVLTA
jgi:hypothetical protein